jgi:DNA-binding response OmpR family regulator
MALILVIEDEADVREVVTDMLTELGYDVRVATTAAEGVSATQTQRPDAILLDIVLPDGSGTTVLDQLRRLQPDVPVIMVTGNADENLARETLKHGAFDYVTKPFRFEYLTRVLEAALVR